MPTGRASSAASVTPRSTPSAPGSIRPASRTPGRQSAWRRGPPRSARAREPLRPQRAVMARLASPHSTMPCARRRMMHKPLAVTLAFSIACAPAAATPRPPAPSANDAATPYFAVTQELLAAWRALRDADHWYYRLQRDVADRTGTKDERYADHGLSAGWLYLISNDRAYAAKAWRRWQQVWGAPTSVAKI